MGGGGGGVRCRADRVMLFTPWRRSISSVLSSAASPACYRPAATNSYMLCLMSFPACSHIQPQDMLRSSTSHAATMRFGLDVPLDKYPPNEVD